jgi:D-threo-aldose 1-dehydrogenase
LLRVRKPAFSGDFAQPARQAERCRRHPLPFEAVYDYSYDGIMRSFEDSFQRLGLARIDIL